MAMLMSASGLGALIAALILARLGDFQYKGKMLILSSLIFSLALILFSLSKVYLLSLIALALVGWGSVTAMAITNTLLQTIVSDEFRGRVMSVFMFTFAGILPFGNLFSGALAHIWGVAQAIATGGVICGIAFVIINMRYPDIRKI